MAGKVGQLGEGCAQTPSIKGSKIPPKYREPGGETWAGRGAKPRWLTALLGDGHSIEEFFVETKGGETAPAAAKKQVVKTRGRKPVAKKGGRARGLDNTTK